MYDSNRHIIATCMPMMIYSYESIIDRVDKMRKFMSLSFVNEHNFFAELLSMEAEGLPNMERILKRN